MLHDRLLTGSDRPDRGDNVMACRPQQVGNVCAHRLMVFDEADRGRRWRPLRSSAIACGRDLFRVSAQPSGARIPLQTDRIEARLMQARARDVGLEEARHRYNSARRPGRLIEIALEAARGAPHR